MDDTNKGIIIAVLVMCSVFIIKMGLSRREYKNTFIGLSSISMIGLSIIIYDDNGDCSESTKKCQMAQTIGIVGGFVLFFLLVKLYFTKSKSQYIEPNLGPITSDAPALASFVPVSPKPVPAPVAPKPVPAPVAVKANLGTSYKSIGKQLMNSKIKSLPPQQQLMADIAQDLASQKFQTMKLPPKPILPQRSMSQPVRPKLPQRSMSQPVRPKLPQRSIKRRR